MVLAREVEEVLHAHPLVANVSVVGVADERWGEAVCAVIQLAGPPPLRPAPPGVGRPDQDPSEQALTEELRSYVRARLAGCEVPKHILFGPALPTTALGKIARGDVQRLAADAMKHVGTVTA